MTTLEQNTGKIGFVFIHGAGLYSGIWSQVTGELDNPCLCIQFPYHEGDTARRRTLRLQDYIRDICRQVESWGIQRFVIVAHSLGGVFALKLAEALGDRVAGLIAIGAVIPAGGGSFLSVFPPVKRILMPLLLLLFGTKPPEAAIRQGLCNDLPHEQAETVVNRFTPESIHVYTERSGAPVPAVPSMYIKLKNDRELSPLLQEQMVRNLGAGRVEALESGHLPMLSRPGELRGILQKFVSEIHA